MTPETPEIRPVQADDLPQVLDMIRALAAQHGDTCLATPDQLARDMLGPDPWMPTWIALQDGQPAGYATLLRLGLLHFGARVVNLHHLFVRPEARGTGLGRALCLKARDEAERMQAALFVVRSHEDNVAAHGFYQSLGMEPFPVEGRQFRWDLRPAHG